MRATESWRGSVSTPSFFPVLAAYVAVVITQAIVLRAQTVLNLGIEYRFIALLRSRLYEAVANARWLFVAQSRGTDFSHALTTELDRTGLATYQLLWSASTHLRHGGPGRAGASGVRAADTARVRGRWASNRSC